MAEVPGDPLPLRLVVTEVHDLKGRVLARWLLLTNVPVTVADAATIAHWYYFRWRIEGLFRTYKRTLAKVRLVGRTVRAVHREAYVSLLSCQLLLAQGAWSLRRHRDPEFAAVVPCSARQAILVMRQELIAAMKPDRRATYLERLGTCARAP